MEAIKTLSLTAYFALAESESCSNKILLIIGSTEVLSSSIINIKRADQTSKN